MVSQSIPNRAKVINKIVMTNKLNHGFCNSPDHILTSSRRGFLQVGFLGGLGLALGDVLKCEAAGATAGGTAKSVINIYLPGGMSHQESFDPKMFAPIEYRGPMGTVKTSVDGVYFSENLKETAKIAADMKKFDPDKTWKKAE